MGRIPAARRVPGVRTLSPLESETPEGGVHVQSDWLQSVLFDRGYLALIKGEAIKVYLAVVEATGGVPDRSVTLSLRHFQERTRLSAPTIIESLARLEKLGLVVSTTRQRGRIKTYYVADPPKSAPGEYFSSV